MISARGARRLLAAASRFKGCLIVIDELLPFLYNPAGHPRAAAIAKCLGEPLPSPSLVALRYRGESTLIHNEGSASDLEAA